MGLIQNIIIFDTTAQNIEFNPREKELIIMIGCQGSGKTTYIKKNILKHSYMYVNQDTLKNNSECVKLAEKYFKLGNSIVIDNTNPSIKSRSKFIALAKKYAYKNIRAIVINTDIELAKHLNNVRHICSNGTIPKINNICYKIFSKNYVAPTIKEGFDIIDYIHFYPLPEFTTNKRWLKYFRSY